jgi:CheY-like chemotaxis protein
MRKCRILLVDDDMEDYLILKDAFQYLGVDILHYASSAKLALEKLEQWQSKDGTLPNIIVLDINMPVMNGPAFLKLLREDPRYYKIPVVIYTTSIYPSDELQCMQLGVEYCLTKPGEIEEIIKVGETLLELCKRSELVNSHQNGKS